MKRDLEEEKRRKAAEVAANEVTAMKCAIEERNRILREAEQKREMEAKDAEESKKVVLREVQDDFEFKLLCSKDEETAMRLHQQLQDELYAAELQRIHDQERELEETAHRTACAKIAEEDAKLAEDEQVYFDRQYRQEMKKVEEKDYELSKKLVMKQKREEHRRMKRIEWISSEDFKPYADSETISSQWRNAESEFENVTGGVCVTIILPHLSNVRIYLKSAKKVAIDATRQGHNKDCEYNAYHYDAEFVVEGKKVLIEQKDLSYEYSSETGLLHIYIENLCLNEEIEGGGVIPFLSKIKSTFSRLLGTKEK